METNCDKYIKNAKIRVLYIVAVIISAICKDVITPLLAGVLTIFFTYKAFIHILPYSKCITEYNKRNKPPY